MTARPALALRVGALASLAVFCACTRDPTPPPSAQSSPGSSVVGSVALPAPQQRGEQVSVEGRVSWTTARPGCALLQTTGGQRFHLTGDVAVDNAHRAAALEQPAVQHVVVTGYVLRAGATVCGARPFVTGRIAPVHR